MGHKRLFYFEMRFKFINLVFPTTLFSLLITESLQQSLEGSSLNAGNCQKNNTAFYEKTRIKVIYNTFNVSECKDHCRLNSRCQYWTFQEDNKYCDLFEEEPPSRPDMHATSGSRACAIMTTPTRQTPQTTLTTQNDQNGVCSSLMTVYTQDCQGGVTNEEECLKVMNILKNSCEMDDEKTPSTLTTQTKDTTNSTSTTPPSICNEINLLAKECTRKSLTVSQMSKQCEDELSIAKEFCGYGDQPPVDNNQSTQTNPFPMTTTTTRTFPTRQSTRAPPSTMTTPTIITFPTRQTTQTNPSTISTPTITPFPTRQSTQTNPSTISTPTIRTSPTRQTTQKNPSTISAPTIWTFQTRQTTQTNPSSISTTTIRTLPTRQPPQTNSSTMTNSTCSMDSTTGYLLINATSTCLNEFKGLEQCGFGKNGADMDKDHCQDIWNNFKTHCGYFEKPCISDLCQDLVTMAEKCAFESYTHSSDEACLVFAEKFKSHCGYNSN